MMRKTRESAPEAEFILVSSMMSNPAVADAQPLIEFRAEMKKLAGNDVALADVTAITRHLLQTKPFIDISVNNFNHPNDHLLRWYAQVA
ncbi:MAG: SGNH/GDSL hydrolase family protein, partial [Verrucomicrobiota bacterium]